MKFVSRACSTTMTSGLFVTRRGSFRELGSYLRRFQTQIAKGFRQAISSEEENALPKPLRYLTLKVFQCPKALCKALSSGLRVAAKFPFNGLSRNGS